MGPGRCWLAPALRQGCKQHTVPSTCHCPAAVLYFGRAMAPVLSLVGGTRGCWLPGVLRLRPDPGTA